MKNVSKSLSSSKYSTQRSFNLFLVLFRGLTSLYFYNASVTDQAILDRVQSVLNAPFVELVNLMFGKAGGPRKQLKQGISEAGSDATLWELGTEQIGK